MEGHTAIVRPYTGAVGSGFLLPDNAWPHVARVCRQFQDDYGIDAIYRSSHSTDLNPVEILCDIVVIRTSKAPQTVQEH